MAMIQPLTVVVSPLLGLEVFSGLVASGGTNDHDDARAQLGEVAFFFVLLFGYAQVHFAKRARGRAFRQSFTNAFLC
jgi:hypothetical protein